MAIKGQMFFSQNVGSDSTRDYGWSEGVYCITAGNLTQAISDMNALAVVRLGLVGTGATLDYIRVSDNQVLRDSQVLAGSALPKGTVLSLPVSDFSWSSFLIRAEGGTTFRSRCSLWMNAMPDSWQQSNLSDPSGTAQYVNSYLAWSNVMLNGKYGFNSFDYSGANPPKTITSVGNVVPYPVGIPAHGWVTGQVILVRGVRGNSTVEGLKPTPPNGFYQITVIDANTVSLNGYNGAQFVYINGGQAFKKQYLPIAFNKLVPRGFRGKKKGGPILSPRSRSRIKR